jgi:molybdenum cofactor cytidylyltransferase
MPGFADLACILLAAGEGRRFGGRKLEAELDGKMLGLYAAETVAGIGFGQLVAVSNAANISLNRALTALGFQLVINPDPSAGQALSLRLGIEALGGTSAAGALIALGDMPYIGADHVQALVAAFNDHVGNRAICSATGTTRMPPAVFPRKSLTQLRQMEGDIGARTLLVGAVPMETTPATLRDIDLPDDLHWSG